MTFPLPRFCTLCAAELVTRVPPLDDRERFVCPKCDYVHYVQPKVAAGSIPEWNGKIAIIRRGLEPRAGFWSFPCGYMEFDEDVVAAARRETEEETGLRVEITGSVGVYSYPKVSWGGSIVILVYRSRVLGGSPTPGGDVTDVRLIAPEEIPWGELAFPSTESAFRDWLRVERTG